MSEPAPVLCGRCLQLRLAQPARATFFPNVADETPLCTIHWQEKVAHSVTGAIGVACGACAGHGGVTDPDNDGALIACEACHGQGWVVQPVDDVEFSVTLSAAQLDLIQRAAALCRVSVEQFMLDSALLRSRKIRPPRSIRPVESVRPL